MSDYPIEFKDLEEENKRLQKALRLATDYLKEWQSWYEKMGKHQQYDFRDKLKEIAQVFKRE